MKLPAASGGVFSPKENKICLKKAGDYPEAVRGASGSRSVPPQAERGGKSEHHRARRPVLNGGLPGNIPEERNVSQKRYILITPKGVDGKKVKWWCKRPPRRQ
jgi:hypothetical protein